MKRQLIFVVLMSVLLSVSTISYADEQKKDLKWDIYFGSYSGVEKFAIKEIHSAVSDLVPYCVNVDEVPADSNDIKNNSIIIGTCQNNPLIDELVNDKKIKLPGHAEGYVIYSSESLWGGGRRFIVIAGEDERGVLYGVEDFCARKLAAMTPDYATAEKEQKVLDLISDFEMSDYPKIAQRGIWTWGYKIYDYRRFLDNMARVKLNMITIWNEQVPVNIDEFIDYAHSRGIDVVMGFDWGWAVADASITTDEGRAKIKRMILDNFEKNYSKLDLDAIYFQTQTEHFRTGEEGESLAGHLTKFVNDVSSDLLENYPELEIHFGLHATSIQDNYKELDGLLEEVVIVWEDAGVIPYFYSPTPEFTEEHWKQSKIDIDNSEGTIAYSKKLATFRPGTAFGMVAKGWANLNWGDFSGHKSFLIGEYSRDYVHKKHVSRDIRWNRINNLWNKNYKYALNFYREMLPICKDGMIVQALVEDGVFEEAIEPAVSLFGVMVWDPSVEENTMMDYATSLYYENANRIK